MRLTLPVCKHNLWRQFKATWQVKSQKRKVLDTGLNKLLAKKNIEVVDANEFVALPKIQHENVVADGPGPMAPKTEQEHPDYHENRIFVFKDNNVLLEGLEQAKLLTNTIEPEQGCLPQQLVSLIDAVSLPGQDKLVEKCIKSSAIYETEQVKLPIRKNPNKRMWVYSRDYGISQARKTQLLCSRLVQLCEMISGARVSQERIVINDARFSVPVRWNDRSILLDLRADLLLASTSALPPVAAANTAAPVPLPDMGAVLPIVSLDEANVYQYEDKFPMQGGRKGRQIHTAIVHCNEEEVKNLYETEVLPTQFTGRSLMKAFAFAVAQARQIYGNEHKGELPVPVTTQLVHTNGQWFHFSVLQLNTTDLVHESARNFLWSAPFVNLYSFCGYEEGRPSLQDYNPQVFKTLLAFYNNGT